MTDGDQAFRERAETFLRFVVDHSDNPMETVWGPYRCFDGYALAHLALGEQLDAGKRRLIETLEMAEQNIADEKAGRRDQWHLADFALQPLLRCWFLCREKHFVGDPLWDRIGRLATGYYYHFGGMSENHNLLHLAGRYLAAQSWPDTTFDDGRSAAAHFRDSQQSIREWFEKWVTRGSTEWGTDIYANVNLLALMNLFEFADDPAMRDAAKAMIDLFLLDEALDSFAGANVGAARRSYGCYRIDVGQSPSRPMHYLYFGTGGDQPFNLNFIGAVIQAATSAYRPDQTIVRIAMDRETTTNRTCHTVGLWFSNNRTTRYRDIEVDKTCDHLSKSTWRSRDVMLSVMNSPGGFGRSTEQVWQATFDEQTLVFSNHPNLLRLARQEDNPDALRRLSAYETTPPGEMHPYWVEGNVPPGSPGDIRPGYWQGNVCGPRSYGEGPMAMLIYDIEPREAMPWAHVFFPRRRFDELREQDPWLFARKGDGYLALWVPTGYKPTMSGVWRDVELRMNGARSALIAIVGRRADHATLDDFADAARSAEPTWDNDRLLVCVDSPVDSRRIELRYDTGPSDAAGPINTRFNRIDSPWGAMPLGDRRIDVQYGRLHHQIALP